ncbi:Hypothetical Protein SiL_0961 [Sulfolobus islandicus LAL14/1]|uniref:Uncharacterized protein n=1 Tax=Saccharolobus islandicus LAL14/1 TaxID=1241935 RepID=M9UD02_SACIS|nr:Hypothetical Protein SiL_0961 [Sulfolobus islandicus LAL14/1]
MIRSLKSLLIIITRNSDRRQRTGSLISELPRPCGQGISTSRWGFPASQSNLDPPSPTAEVPSNGTVL